MPWLPITRTPIQYEKTDGNPANGYYLKFYLGGTTTPTVIATDSTGATQIAKCKLNEMGFPISNPSDETSIFIPHVNSSFSSFRYVIYLSAADADANNFASAIVNLPAVSQTVDIQSYLTRTVKTIDTYADISGALSSLEIGQQFILAGHTVQNVGGGIFNVVSAGSLTSDTGTTVVSGSKAAVRKLDGFVTPEMFGYIGFPSDSTVKFREAVAYAESRVHNAVDSIGDKVGGFDVLISGEYKVTDPIRVSKSNVSIISVSGATVYPYFTSHTGYNVAKPVFIIGSAEVWQNSGTIGDSTKYNKIKGINIKAVDGYESFIGFLFSGTRNPTIRECFVERGFCGIFLENTSELYSDQFSSIGCTYGSVMDNRANRIAANSVLNVACTDNDVSSNKLDMTTIYYSQHTAILAINTGTTALDGMTIGVFSDNPSASSPGLGLPASYAGVHVWGNDAKWTRAMLLDSIVFEANQSENHTCILIESSTQNNPVLGVTINNAHVQTYASDPVGGILTTLIEARQTGDGDVHNIVVSNSGFTCQSDGVYTGRMCNVIGSAGVRFENCYPPSAFALSNLGYYGTVDPVSVIEHVTLDAFPPTGWTSGGTVTGCSKVGGSSGIVPYLEFTGDAGDMYIEKTFDFIKYMPQVKSVFISFIALGDADLLCLTRVNGAADTDSDIVDGTNIARYGQAIVPNSVNASGWRRLVYCFNPFSANYDFQLCRVRIGRKANATASKYCRIGDVRIGYFSGDPVPYNPFS